MRTRLRSLDYFRGVTIVSMIVVNNPGSWSHVYPALLHAPWHGWTPTDLIFPFFLFIVGAAIPFSLGARVEAGTPPARLLGRVARRSGILVALGLLLAAYPFFDLSDLRLPGVLQRIGAAYLVTGAAFLYLSRRGLLWLTGACLAGFHAALAFVSPPGGRAGDLEPETNLAAYLDRVLLPGSLYQGSWDPEGVLSTVPAIASALIGVFAGAYLRSGRSPAEKTSALLGAGFVLLSAGWIWSFWLPINKNLWTSSYAVFTGGIALSCLALSANLLDYGGRPPRWGRPFIRWAEAAGKNSILIFVGSGLLAKTLLLFPAPGAGSAHTRIWESVFASWLGPLHGSLGFALTHTALWIGVAVFLDRRRIYFKV